MIIPLPEKVVDEAPTARSAYTLNTLVLIKGLVRKHELNGRSGVVVSYDKVRARYAVAFADKQYHVRWQNVELHPTQRERDALPKGDEVVFLSEAELRDGMYSVKIDPQFYYDAALGRVFEAANEFEVLELEAAPLSDSTLIKRQYRKISLSVHPDKNKHPQAAAAFREIERRSS